MRRGVKTLAQFKEYKMWDSVDKRELAKIIIILALLVLALCLPGYQV